MNKISFAKNRYYSKAVVLVLLLLAVIFSIFQLNNIRQAIISQKGQIKSETADLLALDKLEKDFNDNSDKLKKTLDSLPESYFDVGKFAYKVENLAKNNNLPLEISFDRDANIISGVDSVAVKFETTGSYQNYRKFLSSLTDMPYNLSVVKIELVSDKGSFKQTTYIVIFIKK